MPPTNVKRTTRTRQPLTSTTVCEQPLPNLMEIFNSSQHVTTSDLALGQLKKLHKTMEFNEFEKQFRDCVRKLLQSKQTIYFKTSCDFLCKFLQYLSKLSDEAKIAGDANLTVENTAPLSKSNKRTNRKILSPGCSALAAQSVTVGKKRVRPAKRGTKRKASVSSEDELTMCMGESSKITAQESGSDDSADELTFDTTIKRKSITQPTMTVTPITNHDRLISSCIDVADMYMQVSDEECRLNAVFFICKFLAHVESLDEEICDALKLTLPKRIRDRKPVIRAQAVLASRTFQSSKLTQEGFRHHFERDPELVVRKALLQIMDTKIFGHGFLVASTQDFHAAMRKASFQRLGKVSPSELDQRQIHQVILNGLNERDRQASYAFKTCTLEPWLNALYDGIDLIKLVEAFDVIDNHSEVCRLLEYIYERNLEELMNLGTTTKLHQVVETFKDNWLSKDNLSLPDVSTIDERLVTVWLTLVNFCKKNQGIIKPIRIRPLQQAGDDPNESIEKILDSQNKNDEVIDLYERLTPDLVNLIDFLKRFVQNSAQTLRSKESESNRLEFIYQQIIQFILSHEIGDELERKMVQEVLGNLLKENLLTGKFKNFIPPIVRCLSKLIYSSSSNSMINYISELIHNVRSHLEDLDVTTRPHYPASSHSTIAVPISATRSTKKVRIANRPKRQSLQYDMSQQNLEFKIATIRVEIEELKDKFEECIKKKDFDGAKTINNKIDEHKAELALLHDRRCSMASDVSHMSIVVDDESSRDCKFSSTMIGDKSLNDTQSSVSNKEEIKIFKHHSNELVKCLQMYLGCLQSVNISSVPLTMLNHLNHLSYEALDECFKDDSRVRSLMVACNGITACVDREYAMNPTTITLLSVASQDRESIQVRTVGFKSLVDVVCQHINLEIPFDKIEKCLNMWLRDYGKYNQKDMRNTEMEFITAVIEGTTKLFYFGKLTSPQILSHLIIWWYHPKTPSRLRQFIGVFLPTFVNDALKHRWSDNEDCLAELLQQTFVTSIEFLHDYILGPGFNIMGASDIHNLINFLCNLIPIKFHSGIMTTLEERIDEIPDGREDLLKFLKQSKSCLASISAPIAQTLQVADKSHL